MLLNNILMILNSRGCGYISYYQNTLAVPIFVQTLAIMKPSLLVLLLIFFVNTTFCQDVNHDFKKLNWLIGTWIRTGMKPGKTGTETWSIASSTRLIGKGVTLKGTNTAVVEKLQLVIKGNAIFYVGDVAENAAPVYFKISNITDNSFVCENPEHDFPKKIAYTLTDGKLKATISGDGKSIDYYFVKQAACN